MFLFGVFIFVSPMECPLGSKVDQKGLTSRTQESQKGEISSRGFSHPKDGGVGPVASAKIPLRKAPFTAPVAHVAVTPFAPMPCLAREGTTGSLIESKMEWLDSRLLMLLMQLFIYHIISYHSKFYYIHLGLCFYLCCLDSRTYSVSLSLSLYILYTYSFFTHTHS